VNTRSLTRDRLRPFGLSRSPLGKLLAEVERLDAATRVAHERFAAARSEKAGLQATLARKAAAAATAGEPVDLANDAATAEHRLTAAQAEAKGTLDARAAAVGRVAAFLRTDAGAEVRARILAEVEERRTRALELLATATDAVDDMAEALAIVDALAAPPAGVSPSLTVKPNRLGKAAGDLAAEVAAAAPKAPTNPASADRFVTGMVHS
jgi:hypothetical protein